MARKVFADQKAGMANRMGQGKSGYASTQKNLAACDSQVKVVSAEKFMPNFEVYAMTGPSTHRNKAPKLPRRK